MEEEQVKLSPQTETESMIQRISRKMKLQVQEVGVTGKGEELPEEMKEFIIARMPFPSIFKARALSTTWLNKFQETSFQKEISLVSYKWPTYCPIFVNKDGMIGFNLTLSQWEQVLFYRPSHKSDRPLFVSCVRALLCFISSAEDKYTIFVYNPLTTVEKKWMFPEWKGWISKPLMMHLLLTDSSAHKIIVIMNCEIDFEGIFDRYYFLHAYDSETDGWSGHSFHANLDFDYFFRSAAYVNQNVYGLREGGRHILSQDGRELILSCLIMDNKQSVTHRFIVHNNEDVTSFLRNGRGFAHTLVCRDRIFICICAASAMLGPANHMLGFYSTRVDSILIFELNVESWSLTQIAKGPEKPITRQVGELEVVIDTDWPLPLPKLQIISHGNVIYFGQNNPFVPVLTFDLQSKKWDSLPAVEEKLCPMPIEVYVTWGTCAFQPGLNPFAEV